MNIHLGIPQILIIFAYIAALVITAHRHGEMQKQNFWHTFIGAAVGAGILIWGGFFG